MTASTRKADPTQQPKTSRAIQVGAVLIAVVVAMTALAFVLGNSSDGDEATGATTAAHIPTGATSGEVSAVAIDGDALPRLETAQGIDPARGMQAPSITATYFDDTEVTINFADGQPRALAFFAHWCPHCQAEVKSLVQRFGIEGIRDDIDIIAISTGVDDGAPNYPPSRWLRDEQWPLPVLRDSGSGDLAGAFGLTGFPFIVVVDADGKVVQRHSGVVPEAEWNPLLELAVAN